MATFVMAALAASVALGYFVIAAVIAPRIKMPSVSSGLLLAIRGAAMAFFIGCGATHIHILVHALEANPQPVETHEIVFHTMQAIGAWLFIAGALMRLELHIVPSPRDAALRAAVEEQRRLADHATKRASQDELTGLARRWRFDEELERQVALAARHGTQATLLLIDVDGLKRINDTLGHQAGDRTLQHVAAAIRDHIRLTDMAARIGGDEFAIILPEAGGCEADRGRRPHHRRGRRTSRRHRTHVGQRGKRADQRLARPRRHAAVRRPGALQRQAQRRQLLRRRRRRGTASRRLKRAHSQLRPATFRGYGPPHTRGPVEQPLVLPGASPHLPLVSTGAALYGTRRGPRPRAAVRECHSFRDGASS